MTIVYYTVDHSAGEYMRQYTLHTIYIESVWVLLKRQITSIQHGVLPKHVN